VLQLSAAVPALTINGVQFALGVGGSAVGGTVDTAGFDAGISANILGTGSLTKQGAGTLILEGLSTYTGDTLVNAGALVLSNSATLASSNIIIGGSATLDVSGLFSPFVLVSGQSLGNSSSTALLNGSVDATVGGLALAYASGTPAVSVANGSLTLDAATLATVNNTGAALGNGSYKLISAGTGGSVVGTAPGTVTVAGNGLGTGGSASLSLTGGELFLDVTGAVTVDTTPTNVTAVLVGGTNLNLSWPGSHIGWSLQAQTNDLNVGLQPGAWVTVPGSETTNAVSIPINPADPTVFFRLVYP
jgi:autotransporter-associated beta strand protein